MKAQKKPDRVAQPLTDEEKRILKHIQRRDFIVDSIIAALLMIAGAFLMIMIGWALGW